MGPGAEVVAFDLYGTLLDIARLKGEVEAAAGAGSELLTRWRRAQIDRTWSLNREGRYQPFDEVTAAALAQEAPALDAQVRARLCASWLTLPAFSDAATSLARLRAAGRRCAVLSNGTAPMIRAALQASGLAVEAVLSVDEVRVYKPDRRVYALLDRLAPRDRLLFVSANGWDAQGCKEDGRTVAFLERGGPPPALAPDLRAGSLGALVDLVLG